MQTGECHSGRVIVKAVDTSAAGPDATSIRNYNTGSIHGGFMLLAERIHYTDAATEVAYREKTATSDVHPVWTSPPSPTSRTWARWPIS